MSTERKESNLAGEGTTVENKQSKASEEPPDPSSSSSESSSDGGEDPAYVPLAQSFPSSESSEEEETVKDSKKGPKKAGLGLFLRGFETEKSKARKRRRFGSLKQPDEPAHVRRQKREYYDSDNSYEALQAPGYDKFKADTVDYYELAARKSCNDPIFTKFQQDEVSELIGYAIDPKAQASISMPAIFAGLPAMLNDRSDSDAPHAASIRNSTSNKKVNPLLGLPSTPLPTSHLRYISKLASQGPNFNDKLENRFSDSALVATGMLVEEMITASLMPLAGYHVMRCRELEARRDKAAEEDEDSNNTAHQTTNMNRKELVHPVTGKVMPSDKLLIDPLEKPSEEWTLPPGEAMMKLLEQDAIPPEGVDLTPPATRTLGDPNRKTSEKNQHAMQLWSNGKNTNNKMDRKRVMDNMDIYRLFLRTKNYKDTILNPSTEETKGRKGRPAPQQQSLYLDSDPDLDSSEDSSSD